MKKLMIATAGAGKTTYLAKKALEIKDKRVLITTYTRSNAEEIRQKIKNLNNGIIPDNLIIEEWFTFLLNEGVKPYKVFMDKELRFKNVGFMLTSEKSGKKTEMKKGKAIIPVYFKEEEVFHHYFTKSLRIYSDKISKFVCSCDQKSNGAVLKRIEDLYPHIFIDEVQDLAGYDLEFIKLLLSTTSNLLLVGDPRQTVYITNSYDKYKKYRGGKIEDFIKNECKKVNVSIDTTTLSRSHRNNASIAKISSLLYPNYPESFSCTCQDCKDVDASNQGVFVIKTSEVARYQQKFTDSQVLRYSNSSYPELNFGESKGSGFERVIIYPTAEMKEWFMTGKKIKSEQTTAKLYVALTRAKYSAVIVIDEEGASFIEGVHKYSLEDK